jgi:hypothetical protein
MVLIVIVLVSVAFRARSVALAGDGWTNNADCWRGGTPLICRDGWGGANTYFVVFLVDQLGAETDLRIAAQSAASSWTSAAGPQSFSWTSGGTNAYLMLDGTQPYGSMITYNFRANGTIINFMGGEGRISFSHIKTSPLNRSHPARVGMWSHEMGHALGLGHHTNENTAVMWPTNDRVNWSPTDFDIGPRPPCSGITPSYLGIRCIYNFDLP